MIRDEWECTACKWTGQECDIRKEKTFTATREEPEEWEWYCPDCNKSETLQEVDEILCATCEDEPVKEEGNICSECMTCHAEALFDESIGH